MTTEISMDAVYEAWRSERDEDGDQTRERFDEALIGEFFDTEELAKYLVDEAGMADVDDLINKVDSHLAPYFKFDYAMYGRDLDFGGDVYTVELQLPIGTAGHTIKRTFYFWSSI